MGQQLFADGIGSIAVLGGAVRLELFSFSPTEKEANGLPKIVTQHEIVMTVNGFLHSAEKIREAVDAIGKIGAPHAAGLQQPAPAAAEAIKVVPPEPAKVVSPEPVVSPAAPKVAKPPFP